MINPLPTSQEKFLIQYGWDSPHAEYLRDNIHKMECYAPFFDGLVYRGRFVDGPNHTDLRDVVFGATPQNLNWANLEPDAEAARKARKRAFRFSKFFLVSTCKPCNVAWYDNSGWEQITHNATLFGRFALESEADGIYLDLEPYLNYNYWNYSLQPDKASAGDSYATYKLKVRARGRGFIRGVQAGLNYKPIPILTPLGHEQAPDPNLETAPYGLTNAFLDGLFEAAINGTVIHNGYEPLYQDKSLTRLSSQRNYVRGDTGLKTVTQVPTTYDAMARFAPSIWLDPNGWDTANPNNNYWKPDELPAHLVGRLQVADEIAWVYSQNPNFWGNQNLIQSVNHAMMLARQQYLMMCS